MKRKTIQMKRTTKQLNFKYCSSERTDSTFPGGLYPYIVKKAIEYYNENKGDSNFQIGSAEVKEQIANVGNKAMEEYNKAIEETTEVKKKRDEEYQSF